MLTLFQSLVDWLQADLFAWTVRMVHVSAVGQTLFVVLWATLPWWRTTVGQALMVKSAALAVYLDWTLLVYYFGPFDGQKIIAACLFGLITVGIWSQVVVIVHEMWKGRSARS